MSKLEQKRLIERYLQTISDLSEYPLTREQAIKEGKKKVLHIESNYSMGGYRLVLDHIEEFTTYGVFGGTGCEPRMKAPAFIAYLQGLIAGMEHMKRNERQH